MVVVDGDTTIVEIARECVPAFEGIVQRLGNGCAVGCALAL
jgi:hypothetical protein